MGTSPKTGEEYGSGIVFWFNFLFLNRPMGTFPKTGEEYGEQKDFFDPNSQNLTF